jgi:hypothetical protein
VAVLLLVIPATGAGVIETSMRRNPEGGLGCSAGGPGGTTGGSPGDATVFVSACTRKVGAADGVACCALVAAAGAAADRACRRREELLELEG